jgi:tRNA A37 threonylcarbamoyladenosine synthetase subunit TsaC/SUA5/YrdC
MAATPPGDVRDERADARRVFEVVKNGGIAIIPLTVSYAIFGHTEAAVRRIYAAKKRSSEKVTGILGPFALHRELHMLDARKLEMVQRITQEKKLPMGVVAPYRADHPFLKLFDPWVLGNATARGTLNILLNVGELRETIAELSFAEGVPCVGSSANVSMTGSKFRLEDIEPAVREIADIEIDYGECRYANPQGLSSTMIDFSTMRVVRVGACYDDIAAVLKTEFDVELDRPAKK